MSSDNNPDIRQQVDANRGTAKKLELLIPGLKGYRTKEDIRVSDELLRNQVANKLDQTKSNLENLRKQMVTGDDFTNLSSVGSLISQVQQLSGVVRHSQQGYSGFAATIQIDQNKLNSLYDYDYAFVSAAVSLLDATSSQKLIYDSTSPNSVQSLLMGIQSTLADFKGKWAVRLEAIENIMVK
ncbi:MAG: hypothetical protein ACYC7D_07195 [Nitrososphaerales archaeon]